MPTITGFSIEIPQEVVRRAQVGDLTAFEQIYTTYAKACYLLAWRVTGHEATAQDVVQETFIKVIDKIGSFRRDGLFAGWLRQIAVRIAINRLTSENRLHLVAEEELFDKAGTASFDQEWADSCRDLNVLAGRLSPTSRAVLFLHEVEGFSHKEIAALFDKSESFSKVTLSRAYARLKQIVAEEEPLNALNQ